MRLAHVVTTRRGGTDRLLTRFAAECRRAGLRPAGLVQANTARAGTHHCDMDVTVLPDGGTYRISQSLGRGARGCRLDAAALEQAVSEVRQGLAAARPDILVVNKFGRHEAAGGGFRDVIAGALMDDVPVLVGVGALNLAAFTAFTGGMAERLPPERAALMSWLRGAAGAAVA